MTAAPALSARPHCPECGGAAWNNGKRANGTARFRCRVCGHNYTAETAPSLPNREAYSARMRRLDARIALGWGDCPGVLIDALERRLGRLPPCPDELRNFAYSSAWWLRARAWADSLRREAA